MGKKKLAGMMALLMAAAALAACGTGAKEGSEAASGGAAEESSAPESVVQESSGAENSGTEETSKGTAEGKKIGVAYCTLAEEFAVDLQKGVQDKAKELGFEISEVDYALDLAKGNDEVDNFINMQVDAVILWPLDATAFAGASDKLTEAGIPIVTVDSTVEKNVATFVTSDNRLGGKEAAKYGLDAIGGKGKVLIITPAPGMTSLEERCEGYYDALAEYPDIEVVEQMDAGIQARAGYAQSVENALNANPDVSLVLANCGDCALGALSTVEMYPEKYKDVKIIGYDATDEQIAAMKEGRQIIASMAQFPYDIGTTAVEQVQKILNGEEVEELIRTAGGLVTPDNLEDFGK